MYEERLTERHKQGLLKFTGDNAGLLYTNERKETESTEDGEREVWVYDVYEVDETRFPGKAKCEAIETQHPNGDEAKILRKTLAKVLKKLGDYDTADYAEFKAYNEFAEGIGIGVIRGSETASDPTDEELLEKAKTAKIAEIDRFNSSANVNAFTVNGLPMWLDFDMRSRLKNSIDAADAEGRESLTKVYEGMTFTYPVSVWRQMFTEVENYAGDCQNITEQHKAAVRAMVSVAEVEAFDVTLGYPKNPSF